MKQKSIDHSTALHIRWMINQVDRPQQKSRAATSTDLALEGGRIHGVIGRNGSGKTTFLRVLATLDTPWTICAPYHVSEIDLEVAGNKTVNILTLTEQDRARYVAWVEAQTQIVFGFSTEDVLGWAIDKGHPTASVIEDVMYGLQLKPLMQRPVRDLSLGEQKRVHIARGILQQSKVLLLDEPLGPLDYQMMVRVMDYLRSYASASNAVVVMSVHDVIFAQHVCASFTLINQLTVTMHGNPLSVLTSHEFQKVMGITIKDEALKQPLFAVARPNGD